MILRNPVTGHEVTTDEASADFWTGAGYREQKPPAKKAAAKKSSSAKK